jgi:hypothetical protein
MSQLKTNTAFLVGGFGLLLLSIFAVNCDTVETAFDCESVCTRYRDCYDASYNVDNCRSSCRSRAANDSTVRQAADTCEACIGDKSCLSAPFQCGGSCSNIVP